MPRWTSCIKGHDSNRAAIALLICALAVPGAQAPAPPKPTVPEAKLSSREHALKDIARMKELAGEIRKEFDQSKQHVLSMKTLERLEEIEKLSKETRGRLAR